MFIDFRLQLYVLRIKIMNEFTRVKVDNHTDIYADMKEEFNKNVENVRKSMMKQTEVSFYMYSSLILYVGY
jgi:hypothetical protein